MGSRFDPCLAPVFKLGNAIENWRHTLKQRAIVCGLVLAFAFSCFGSISLVSAEAEQRPLWRYWIDGPVKVAISSDGNYIVAGGGDGKIYLFSRENSTPLWSHTVGGIYLPVAISSDGSYVVSGGDKVRLFSRASSTPLWSYDAGYWIISVAISSDGNYIVAGGWDNNVYLFSR